MSKYLGLDCGGSTTRALLVDSSLRVLGEGRSGPANLASTDGEDIERHLREAVSGLERPDFVFGCFAGLLTEADRHRAVWYLMRTIGGVCEAGPDYFAALAADGSTDVIVIAGTGSLVASRLGEGVVKSGGGGIVLSDEGSLADIGRQVLANALLGPVPFAGPMSGVRSVCGDVFGTTEPNEVIASLYRDGPIAVRLAKVGVWAIQNQGQEEWVSATVETSLARLAERLTAHIESHHGGAKNLTVRLTGGLWEVDPGAVARFNGLCRPYFSGLGISGMQASVLVIEPVVGAARLARELDEHGI